MEHEVSDRGRYADVLGAAFHVLDQPQCRGEFAVQHAATCRQAPGHAGERHDCHAAEASARSQNSDRISRKMILIFNILVLPNPNRTLKWPDNSKFLLIHSPE